MCGIVGYIGGRNAVPILLEGLRRLEYRGYDSAGIACFGNGGLDVRRSVGKLRNLEAVIGSDLRSHAGIGHTRWATHGRPSETNAHPQRSNGLAVVHNGIIENYRIFKEILQSRGQEFSSDTDTEVIAHLIRHYKSEGASLEEATRMALKDLKGSYAIGVVSADEPDVVIAARSGCPLVVGLGQGEHFIASDLPAMLSHTKEVVYLDDLEMAVLTREGVDVRDCRGRRKNKPVANVQWDPMMAEKCGYRHFMHKEIHEQPGTIMDTFKGMLAPGKGVYLDETGLTGDILKKTGKVALVACGTSWHAALIGKFMLEELARLPVEVDVASEYRYRGPLAGPDTLFIAITQSGETADTLAAMREAKSLGARTLAVCNVVGSSAAREADGVLITRAGPEIGVASTKAFTAQLTALFMLAVHTGTVLGTLDAKAVRLLLDEFSAIPAKAESLLKDIEPGMEEIARRYYKSRDFLYLGRGYCYPVALEGALKLKEISYIHAEGYPAGEMKHGPIALIDESTPVVFLAPKDRVYEKVVSNIEEVKSRGGKIIAFVNKGDGFLKDKADHVFEVPGTLPCLNPILMSIPLQLLAYKAAVLLGNDVDQPRNLAKSVTVE